MCFFKKKKEVQEYRKKRIQEAQEHWKKNGDSINPEEIIFEKYPDEGSEDKDEQIVFIDIEYDLDWITKYNLDEEKSKLVDKVMMLTALPYKNLSLVKQKYFLRYLGQGIVAAFTGNDENVHTCVQQANAFHKKATLEWNRLIVLITALLFFIYGIIAAICIYQEDIRNTVLLECILWGFIGSFLSILYKNSSKNENASSCNILLILETIARMIAGCLFGCFSFYLFNSNFLKLNDIFVSTSYNYIVLAFIAGFSETLIPSVVSKYENKFDKNEEK
ncbi:hypothetical protein SAMN05720761_1202 [Fibrobacter sp. UWCM]|uniref:hypothetical protein n=1 Tax=Fibrobacter sp. UWCM TaxID=1896208 RepID=UPI000915228A|nr:hypothetical protein [Fibrobacter sp. UWCM]SHH62219.1 hypothetical protein SAMN05720761_1202 [Fibrobacter sp. UWCM]